MVEIRRLGHSELPDVIALMNDVTARLTDPGYYARDDEQYFRTYVLPNGMIYGAYLAERLVAYSVLTYPKRSERNLGREFGIAETELDRVACLEGTIVHESVRGTGLQRRFHELREQSAIESGCSYLYSTVHPDNRVSVRNLESAGFVLQFTRPMYGGSPRHCYAKTIRRDAPRSGAEA